MASRTLPKKCHSTTLVWAMLLLLGLGGPPSVTAADPDGKQAVTSERPTVELEEVVISATRTPEPASQIPAAPTILTREDLDRTPFRDGLQVDDALRYVPGVQPNLLGSRYNHPTAQALTLRGLGSRRSLVLLDGIPLNDGFGGWINWGLVPNHVDRIEVVPGGGSNLYGTWAMGGIVHVLTEAPEEGLGARVDSRAGNLSTYHQSVMGRYGTDRTGLRLSYRWFHTNGFITVPEDQRGPVDRTNDASQQLFTGTFSQALTPRTNLLLTGSLFREDRTFGTPLSLATRTIGTGSVGLEGETVRGIRWETKLFAQGQTFRNLTSEPTSGRLSEVRDRIQVIPSNDFGGTGQWTIPLTPGHTLVVGADARAIIGESEEQVFTGMTGRSLAGGKQVGWGLFAEWIARPTDRLTVVAGFRSDWWKNFDGRIESTTGTVTLPRDNVETALNPKIGLQYRLTDRVRAGASFYQAFRAPTLNELYRSFAFGSATFNPNENLTPERLIGGEGKVEVDLLPDRRLTLRLTGHYDEVKDQILFISSSGTTFQRRNVGRTRALGGEVDIAYRPTDFLRLHLGYAYADSAIKSFFGDKSREGKRVPNVSRHQVVAGVTVGRPEVVQVSLLGRYLSRQFADDRNTQPIADFVVLDASIQKAIGRHLRLYLDAENLTDRQYIVTQTGSIKTLGPPLLVLGGITIEY